MGTVNLLLICNNWLEITCIHTTLYMYIRHSSSPLTPLQIGMPGYETSFQGCWLCVHGPVIIIIILGTHVCEFDAFLVHWSGAILSFIFQVRSISNSSWFGNIIENDQEKLREKIDPGLRLGDYPVLPWRSAQLEKPTGWWDNQDRRNKETPVSCNWQVTYMYVC